MRFQPFPSGLNLHIRQEYRHWYEQLTGKLNALGNAIEIVTEPKWGAKGDGSTDDTASIQAAIDHIESMSSGGEIVFSPGTYKITSPLTITEHNIRLRGLLSGGGSTLGASILNAGAGDGVYFNGATEIHGCGISNINIVRNTDAPAGSALRLRNCSTFDLNNVHLAEHFNCMLVENVQASKFSKLSCYTGNYFTGATGSALVKWSPLGTTWETSGGICLFDQCVLTSNYISEYCVSIGGVDHLAFVNCYLGGPDIAHVYGVAGAAYPFYSLMFDTVYFDGANVGNDAIGFYMPAGSSFNPTDIKFNNCTFGQMATAINIAQNTIKTVTITNNEFHNITGGCIYLNAASGSFNLVGNNFESICTATADVSAILCENARQLNISGNQFSTINYSGNYGIKLAGTITLLNIIGNSFFNVTNDYSSSATISKQRIYLNTSNNATLVATWEVE